MKRAHHLILHPQLFNQNLPRKTLTKKPNLHFSDKQKLICLLGINQVHSVILLYIARYKNFLKLQGTLVDV